MLNCFNGVEIIFTSKATGQKWLFDLVANVHILEDVNTLTDTCTIEVPKKVKWQGASVGGGNNAPIKRGDKVQVLLGYNGIRKERFVGYVKTVGTKLPTKIECEDGIFLLKLQETVKKTYKQCTLDTLISSLLTGTGISYNLIDTGVKLGNYRITQDTVAKELNELKTSYGLMCYFKKGVLQVGLTYPTKDVNTIKIRHGKELINEATEYKNVDDIKVKIKASSTDGKNVLHKIEVGVKDGELTEIKLPNLTKDELKQFAEQALRNAKYSGLRGSVTTFGEPIINKGDKVFIELRDGAKGTYIAKKVEPIFGLNGYKQTIEIGPIVNDG